MSFLQVRSFLRTLPQSVRPHRPLFMLWRIAIVVTALTVLVASPRSGQAQSGEKQQLTVNGIWTSAEELADVPMSGPGWVALKAAADHNFFPPVVSNNSNTDVDTLAAAIVYAREGTASYRTRVIQAIDRLVSDGEPPLRTLEWSRSVGAYFLAADLVDYRTPALETWGRNVVEVWDADDNRTILEMFKQRPNNWGNMAMGALTAVYAYLGDTARLNEVRDYWVRSINGPTPPEASYGAMVWHPDNSNPRWINPAGATKACPTVPGDPLYVAPGVVNVDGIIPDDMRRNNRPCEGNPPRTNSYPWEGLQGHIMAGRIFERLGMSIWDIGDRAISRAGYTLQVRLGNANPAWRADGDDVWMLPFFDKAYNTNWSGDQNVWGHGKNVGWAYVLLGDGPSAPPDQIPPTVSITKPQPNSSVTGTTTVSADAADNVAVVGVQFKLDGQNLGDEDPSSPYFVAWDTQSVRAGSHTLTAVARDQAGNRATSAPVLVRVVTPTPDATEPIPGGDDGACDPACPQQEAAAPIHPSFVATALGAEIRVTTVQGNLLQRFRAFPRNVKQVSVATGDVNGDGMAEIVVGAGRGNGPQVRVFSATGRLLTQFFAFAKTSRSGVHLAIADIDGDATFEIVAIPAIGPAVIRVFGYDQETSRYRQILEYHAATTAYRGGATLAARDLDQDGRDEILVAPNTGTPRVKVLRYVPERHVLRQQTSFTVFPAHFTTGVSVTTGDFDGDGTVEIAVGSGPGRDPVVRFFRTDGTRRWGFLAGAKSFRGGVFVSTLQADGDAADELVTAPWAEGSATTTIRDIAQTMDKMRIKRRVSNGTNTFQGGVRVTGLEVGE